jgi:pimeloyl-ACP methyl ester carboxylesterase
VIAEDNSSLRNILGIPFFLPFLVPPIGKKLNLLHFENERLAAVLLTAQPNEIKHDTMKNYNVHHETAKAGALDIFYREAGPKNAPVVLLMHGYPTSSFMFRNLIPMLSTQYHVIAPDDSKANRDALRKYFTIEGINFQYRTGVADPSLIAPEAIYLDNQLMERPGNAEIQLDLILDYRTNVKLYPDFQAYFRKDQPRLLAVWGSKDPYFSPGGAEGFKQDDPNTIIQFFDTGHFALETHCEEIGHAILAFLPTLSQ